MTAQCGGEGRVGVEGGREGEGSAVWKGRKMGNYKRDGRGNVGLGGVA